LAKAAARFRQCVSQEHFIAIFPRHMGEISSPGPQRKRRPRGR
jgi:hypothetical protein